MTILKRITPVFVTLALVAMLWPRKDAPAPKTFDEADFDSVVSEKINSISAVDLAMFIKNQSNAYWLIDLRDSVSFEEYHIPTALRSPLKSVISLPTRINDHIFLYCDQEQEAVQAYELLYFRGYFNVRIVSGGLKAWRSEVLFPSKSSIPENELTDRESLSKFFGGNVLVEATSLDQTVKPVEIKSKAAKSGC
ncbi:MAG: rhodanese-like domain-containing protein [Bacteroidetes bacterium]|nr:rhodanese-like domain-containing protein [Bacteroidota bacterium]